MSHSCLGLLEQSRNRPNEVEMGSGKEGSPESQGDGGQQSQLVTMAVAGTCRLLFESPVSPSSTQLTVALGVTRYQADSCACFGGRQGYLFDATLDAR